MLEIPLTILMMLLVFIGVAVAFLLIFGAPNCDIIANTTALQLKAAIDRVASEDTPYFLDSESVPEDPRYYEQVGIRLCQRVGEFSYINSFFGGFPEYQIYFEQFPEGFFSGGAGMWTEAYPWSGGAASTFLFWGIMRGVSFAGKAATLGKAQLFWKIGQFTKWLTQKLRGEVDDIFIKTFLKDPQKVTTEILADSVVRTEKLSASSVGVVINKRHAGSVIDSLNKVGFLDDGVETAKLGDETIIAKVTRDGKLPLNNKDIDLSIIDPNTGAELPVYIKTEGDRIVEVKFEYDPTFERAKINPADAFRNYIDEAPPNERNALKQIFEPDWKEEDLITIARNTPVELLQTAEVTKLGFWGSFNAQVKKFKLYVTSYQRLGYHVEKNIETPLENRIRALALLQWLQRDSDNFNVIKSFEASTSIRARIAQFVGKSERELINEDYYRFIREVLRDTSAISLLPTESKWNIYKAGIRVLRDTPAAKDDSLLLRNSIVRILNEEDFDDVIRNLPTTSPSEFEDILRSLQRSYSSSEAELLNNVNLEYLNTYISRSSSKFDTREATMMMGFLEQNVNGLPISVPAQYGRLQAKKMIYIEGRAMITPNSWIAKGFAGLALTEGCLGNSICVYSHNQQLETPTYLDEETDKFFIRSWRPVGAQAYAGIQAALMHIPSHPRFHVVSPCFAEAKIWKTNYNGEDTIFVKPVKCALNNIASNYCYADEDLINQYTLIWASSDAITVLEGVLTAGQHTLLKSVVKAADPATLIQAVAEAAISWPGYPYDDLTFEEMRNASAECVSPEVLQEIEDIEAS